MSKKMPRGKTKSKEQQRQAKKNRQKHDPLKWEEKKARKKGLR